MKTRLESPSLAGLTVLDGELIRGGWEPILGRTDCGGRSCRQSDGDADSFNAVGREASKDADFIPSIFETLVWLAEQIAIATGSTVDAMLTDYAMTAAAGEAGMLDDGA